MSKIQTHYDNLKVAQNAPPEVIRAAYKVLCQKYHPDKNNNSTDSIRIMKIINEAYEVLSDPIKRKEHDTWILSQNKSNTEQFSQNTNNQNYKSTQENFYNKKKPNFSKKKSNFSTQNTTDSDKPLIIVIIISVLIAIIIYNIDSIKKSFNYFNTNLSNYEQNSSTSEVIDSTYIPEPINEVYKTSFDCNTKKTKIEDLICSNKQLADADLRLSNLITKAKQTVTDKTTLNIRIRNQWNQRNSTCFDIYCLKSWYDYQEKFLNSVIQTRNSKAGITDIELSPQKLPSTGEINTQYIDGVAPLKISVPYDEEHYFIKIEDAYTSNEIGVFFIRNGEELNIDLPMGSYIVKYAYGKTWFGSDYLFGEKTNYAKANNIFHFSFNGYQYSGYSIELIKKVNGNLHTTDISPQNF